MTRLGLNLHEDQSIHAINRGITLLLIYADFYLSNHRRRCCSMMSRGNSFIIIRFYFPARMPPDTEFFSFAHEASPVRCFLHRTRIIIRFSTNRSHVAGRNFLNYSVRDDILVRNQNAFTPHTFLIHLPHLSLARITRGFMDREGNANELVGNDQAVRSVHHPREKNIAVRYSLRLRFSRRSPSLSCFDPYYL